MLEQATAAVINAGFGEFSLGLKAAGFHVVAAYEADKRILDIHRANIDVPIYLCSPEEIDAKTFPKVDLLAAQIHCPPSSSGRVSDVNYNSSIRTLLEILSNCRPRAFFLSFNASFSKNKQLQPFMNEMVNIGYRYICQPIDVAKTTGFPVSDHMVCIVGTMQTIEKSFQFPDFTVPIQVPPTKYLQLDQQVDPWYFSINPDEILQSADRKQFYCWKSHAYMGTDLVQWNYKKIPLVHIGDAFRKITLREIANLKGFPSSYTLPDGTNWKSLYKKLMYTNNVLVIKQIAGILNYLLTDNPWRNQQAEHGLRFERLFGRYLANLADQGTLEQKLPSNHAADFVLHQGNIDLYFDVKYYNSSFALASKVKTACERLSSIKSNGVLILVVANEVSDSVKIQCQQEFQVSIWDVGNLLWLFDEFAEIKNEFIASLDYATERIQPKPPVPNIFENVSETKKEEPTWKDRLLRIDPGREQSQAYESICVEILKFVLGDYLTLWETQKSTDSSLYRFDLCCKIKNGANQDFFDTVKRYFNTKYIVFEFKNYSEKISQKEIYTTEKYLYEKALRKVAIIISRMGADKHALRAASGSLREAGRLILCLTDNDLLEMIDIKTQGEQEPADFLGALLDNLLVRLEK